MKQLEHGAEGKKRFEFDLLKASDVNKDKMKMMGQICDE
jgi:hypothetical protein